MSQEQVKAYLQSGKLVKDLASKATEAGYDVSEEDLEEALGGIKIVADKEGNEINKAQLFSPAGGDKEGAKLFSPAGGDKEGNEINKVNFFSPAGEDKGVKFASPAGENRMDGTLHR